MNSHPPRQSQAAAIWRAWNSLLCSSIDGASLAVLRIHFGMVMLWEAFRFLGPVNGKSRLVGMFAPHQFHFPYRGFEWLPPPSLLSMQIAFGLLGLASIGMILGIWYRFSAAVVFITWNYFFLSDQAYYQNHYYLISLLAGILTLSPAAECWSVDRWRKGNSIQPTMISFWPVFLLRAQLFFMYFFASIAKLEWDWLSGIPIQGACNDLISWLALYGFVFPITGVQLASLMAWGGLVFDFVIGPLLIFRKTRPLAIGMVFAFHGMNEFMFDLAALPYLASGATLIFCDPHWPREFATWLNRLPLLQFTWLRLVKSNPMCDTPRRKGQRAVMSQNKAGTKTVIGKLLPTLIVLFLVLNTVVPVRHLLIGGDPDWTEEGYRFSWRMMQRTQASNHIQFNLIPLGLTKPHAAEGVYIDWSKWASERPAVVFVSTDVHAVPWSHLPEIVLLFEPCVGVRAIGNPCVAENNGRKLVPADLASKWEATTGRVVQVEPAISLETAIDNALTRIADVTHGVPDQIRQIQMRRLNGARQLALVQEKSPRQVIELIDVLHRVCGERGGELVRQELLRTSPFSIQGLQTNDHFVVLNDPNLTTDMVWSGFANLQAFGQPTPILFDQTKLRTHSWRSLPQTMLCENPHGISVNWNHHRELSDFQIRRMSTNPGMIHCYAQHVAERWQSRTGTRPQVYVDSLVSHNRRPLQPMVNPTVDLANCPLAIFGHNSWIAELEERQPLPTPQVGGVAAVVAEVRDVILEQYPSGEKKLTRRDEVAERYTLTHWDREGRPFLEAQYQHGKLDGLQTKYGKNGSPELQMAYSEGKPHGRAIAWNSDGTISSDIEYRNGAVIGKSETDDSLQTANGKLDVVHGDLR